VNWEHDEYDDWRERLPHWLGYWDDEDKAWMIGHSSIALRVPITVDVQQMKLALGITCPRHRAIWKGKLGIFGRWIPDLEWQYGEDDSARLVNVWRR
jgi:hypothetical protein